MKGKREKRPFKTSNLILALLGLLAGIKISKVRAGESPGEREDTYE